MVGTSNGQNEGPTRVPSPFAPNLIAVNKHWAKWSGAPRTRDGVLHGDWSSPVAAYVNGRYAVLFGGGDGLAARLRRSVRVTKSGDLTATRKTPAGFRARASFRAALSLLHRSSPTAASSLLWGRVQGTATALR